MSLSSPCEGQPCRRWNRGHRLLPTQLNVLSRWPDAWRDAFVGALDGCHFDVHVPGFDQAVRCWHHENLNTVLIPGEPIRIAGTLLRLPIGYVNVAADRTPPYHRPLPEGKRHPAADATAVTDLWTGRGLDDRHLTPGRRLTVLIDDVRSFRDGRSCRIARTAADGVALLRALRSLSIDELWLDHDLGSDRRTGQASRSCRWSRSSSTPPRPDGHTSSTRSSSTPRTRQAQWPWELHCEVPGIGFVVRRM